MTKWRPMKIREVLWFVSHYKQFWYQRKLRKKKLTEDVNLLTQMRELTVAALWNERKGYIFSFVRKKYPLTRLLIHSQMSRAWACRVRHSYLKIMNTFQLRSDRWKAASCTSNFLYDWCKRDSTTAPLRECQWEKRGRGRWWKTMCRARQIGWGSGGWS